jgi:hypothetical protein
MEQKAKAGFVEKHEKMRKGLMERLLKEKVKSIKVL